MKKIVALTAALSFLTASAAFAAEAPKKVEKKVEHKVEKRIEHKAPVHRMAARHRVVRHKMTMKKEVRKPEHKAA